MYRWDKALREENPSFSSTLLDKIYRSIDEADTPKREDLRFYRETTVPKKQNRSSSLVKTADRDFEKEEQREEVSAFRRACLIEKWMEKKVSQKVINSNNDNTQQKRHNYNLTEFERSHNNNDHDIDQDVMFFSSTSSSSDSSSGGFSSSDTDSMYGTRSKTFSFCPPPRPKPVKTNASTRSEKKKTEKTERTLFYEQKESHFFDDYHHHYNPASEQTTPRQIAESLIKSKSRALKIYNNLKKVKQPISPGGKLATFINSLFTTSSAKKPKNPTLARNCEEERKPKSGQESTCSSASSFSRSCLSKNSPSTRERLRNGVKRSVRFYPVSVIVDEDCQPCGHKSLYESGKKGLMPLSLPTAWKIGKSPTRKVEEDLKFQVIEKSKKVEEMAREFLKDYHQNQKKKKKNCYNVQELKNDYIDYEDDDDDDAASYSSSDLFELDHLAVIGNHNRYSQELPVYETTRVDTNRAIANGLMM